MSEEIDKTVKKDYTEKIRTFMVIGMAIMISLTGFCALMHIFRAVEHADMIRSLQRLEAGNDKFLQVHDRVKGDLYRELAEIKAKITEVQIKITVPPVSVQQTNTPPVPEKR